MNSIVTAVLATGGAGAVCGFALSLAARYFGREEDPRIREIAEALPGINCGACGFAGCADYARAIVEEGAPPNLCAPGGSETLETLSNLLGVRAEAAGRKVAVVLCGGDDSAAIRRFDYNGIADCAAAAAVAGGDKACAYGCLGYGSCARVCPVNAIEMTPGWIARVHKDRCIGCGRCVDACPRGIIKMVPAERTLHVLCRSPEKGPAVRKVCSKGCIGCRICVKLSDGAFRMHGFLAEVDYEKEFTNEAVVEKCPAKCIAKL